MKVPSGRWIALQALLHLEDASVAAGDALERAWEEAGVATGSSEAARERGLALELTLGVLRWERRLDSIIDRLADKGGASSMHPAVRNLMRLGLYQLMFLDRIPARAAVSETVALSRPAGVGFASGFINAGLRRFDREREARSLPRAVALKGIAERWSHPNWVVRGLAPVLADELEAYLEASQAHPPLTLRVNRLRATPDEVRASLAEVGITATPGAYSPDALILEGGVGNPATLPGFEQGLFTVQDEASQLVAAMLSPTAGDQVLDACAAPGGKSTHLAAMIGDTGVVFAVDVSATRLDRLEEAVQRLGTTSVLARVGSWEQPFGDAPAGVSGQGDPAHPFGGRAEPNPGAAIPLGADEALQVQAALVDAPCSALGVLRRIPEIKRRRVVEDVARHALRQKEILARVAERVAPGGALVYSVCSPMPAEGQEVIADFLSRTGDFEVERPTGGGVPWAELLSEDGALRTYPHRHGCDAFYAVRLVRRARA